MINLNNIYGGFTTIISFMVLINTFINKDSDLLKKFKKNKKKSLYIHSLGFYSVILLHFLNIYFKVNIHDYIFIIIYILGIICIYIGTSLGDYAFNDGTTVYINYIQIIYIFFIRFIINIYDIFYNNQTKIINDNKISTLIMLNSQPLTRFLIYYIENPYKVNNLDEIKFSKDDIKDKIKDEKNNKRKISIAVAQSIMVIGNTPLVFRKYNDIISIIVLSSFLISCFMFNYIIKFRNNKKKVLSDLNLFYYN